MTLQIESREEFYRLAKKLVHDNMLKLSVDKEDVAVELLVRTFNAGMDLALNGKSDIEI